MANKTDSNVYTVVFAAVMVVVVGSILAFLASALRPNIKENERFEKQQNILYAMGVNENGDDAGSVNFIPTDVVEDEFANYIKEQLVIQGDKITEDNEAYLIDLKKQLANIKKGEPYKLPVFIGEKDGKKFYIIPMYGKGLWDAIWGFIALDDTMTVQGVYFDHKGETPGLGANIKMRYFMDDFKGETILNGTQYAGISVAKGNNDPLNKTKDDNEVDALAGATITGNGVSAMISETVKLYKPYLETIRAK
ncbi:MAG: Na(+)-translocating NADH-quinone reductase subunit C [Maribacter dokdonensis]|uniref:Na(+)-translocating NADH-quinone reductase subunit C n=3 Tax=Maribacter TaxID=252356 RepID=A0A1H4JD58_9FLAO|nr:MULTISPECIES: Na(+)-translocating NADH-quinone reductase subunit C [Maribacter]HAF77671.1 NADH:ubiquinone reductase (Na(+)-transporting) subunit C [Maribacter sp.]APA63512.1 NADH:quinone oxidoreductase [Maribacter sp. 1_2014MBL_MicDiv]MBU2899514.1 Na(+)-translocating NADH-quinone reductase subunit C [Maribacter dokdonensis]PHN92070.1 NADH:ubiquinone reductase (Na(+)-transporting) subunit C [Maribacter sp. 6B07]CAG2534003.1 Na+-transporting NADH:ubiquinone oxidoreductase subunit C [Maribacte|tara:strand:- start:13443 stop:14195 length:753 start_codon:yes stop_codon:yes gene_type:complete